MRDALRALCTAVALLAPVSASALPWNIDLVDAKTFKAYERAMAPLPEGVMSQPHLLTPVSWRENYAWMSEFHKSHVWPATLASGEAFDPTSQDVIDTGARYYDIYCTPCHGDGVVLGSVSEKGYPAVAVLAGPDGRLQNQTNGHVYLTIRNGSLSKLMPAYGYAMTDDEMWSVVAYMRAMLPNAVHTPAPPPTPEPTPAEEAN